MTHADIIARLTAATGPDRELDAEIMFDLFAKPFGKKEDGGPTGYLWPEDNPSWNFGIRFSGKDRAWFGECRKKIDGETLLIERDGALVLMNSLRIPALSASIDATVALIGRVLPGWDRSSGKISWSFDLDGNRTWNANLRYFRAEADAPTLPLAILLALFRALEAQEPHHG